MAVADPVAASVAVAYRQQHHRHHAELVAVDGRVEHRRRAADADGLLVPRRQVAVACPVAR
jgi:hypothetical protein